MPSKAITVPAGLHKQARFFASTRRFWQAMGGLESAVLRDELETVTIDRPVYVAALARSGTTILTEMLERHDDATAHHYSDFPNVWTPYWRNYLLQKTRREAPRAEERAHKDRILVSQDSPEAVEEVLWMHFFPQCHEAGRANILDRNTENPEFAAFYRDHIRKLLLVRNARRYVAKGNYNVMRLEYLHRLYPDLRILVPYRDPVDHIASLMKQHRFFLQQDRLDVRVGRHLALSGHFEFGPQRKAVNFGDQAAWQAITTAWDEGREVEGWARYWRETYGFLLQKTAECTALREACRFVSYERLCDESGPVIDALLEHCELDQEPFASVRAYYCRHLSRPDYYSPEFNAQERDVIRQFCQPVHAQLDTRSRSVENPAGRR